MMATHTSFGGVPKAPVDPIYVLSQQYANDPTSTKVDLGAGVLRDEEGKCYEFSVIKKAKKVLAERKLSHDYRPTLGIQSYRTNAARLMFGADSDLLAQKRVATVQTVAGTGACRIAAVFLSHHWPSTREPTTHFHENPTPVYIGTPAWGNYDPLFRHAGFPNLQTYTHLDASYNLDFPSTVKALETAPASSIFVFQGCCHNPTGQDYSRDQWLQIAELMQSNHHFAFFDTAYQGLAISEEVDAWPIRHFAAKGIDMLVCQSFSKNAGLYSERVGALHVICPNADIASNVLDQLRSLTRWEVSSSPAYGAELVNIIMSDPALTAEWKAELETVRENLRGLRKGFYKLIQDGYRTPSPRAENATWDHLVQEKGLFSYTGMTPEQVTELRVEHRVYLPGNGRINVSGLNQGNMERVAKAFDVVIRGK